MLPVDVLCNNERVYETFVSGMRHFPESATAWILEYLEDLLIGLLSAMQEHATTFFRTFLMLLLINLVQLCAYALPKKGGAVNCDNIIWMARISTSWTPWTMCCIASKFSPAHQFLNREGAPKTRAKKRGRRSGHSMDFIFICFLLALCIPTCSAAAGRSDGLDPRGFRAERRSRKLHHAVYNRRTAARDPDSSSSEEDDFWDHLPTTTREFHLFGTGCWREIAIASFGNDVNLLRAGHMLVPDAAVARIGGDGRFIPAIFYPMAGYIPMIWCPRWAEQDVTGALLLIDTSMIGVEPFSVFYPHDKLRYDDLADMLPDIFFFETYVFCMAHSTEPMTSHAEWPVYQGLTLVLQRTLFSP